MRIIATVAVVLFAIAAICGYWYAMQESISMYRHPKQLSEDPTTSDPLSAPYRDP
jgi:hypothetical protein